MLGKRKAQRDLFDVGNVFPLELPANDFFAQIAKVGLEIFDDDKFAKLYDQKNGRPSIPPSCLAVVVIMQCHDGVSDEEAVARTAYDLRWAAALRRSAGEKLCAKSTLQLFRAHLILHDKVRDFFLESIREAKRKGLIGRSLSVAIDTKPILGRGAVQDTLNLLGTAIRGIARGIANAKGRKTEEFLREQNLDLYNADSLKGAADIDWADEKVRKEFLARVVNDAKKLLAQDEAKHPNVKEAADLLKQILLQDIDETPTPDGGTEVSIKKGTATGRVPCATDPEMRHGRKSASKRFDGHKASVAVDIESQIIVAVDVLSGDAPDQTGALELIAEAEANSGESVRETLGDCAYGGGPTRTAFEEAGRTLIAKVPKEYAKDGFYPKSAFQIDLDNNTVTCPAGHTTARYEPQPDGGKKFRFGSVCASCPLAKQCTTSAHGRSLTVHPQEAILKEARALQKSPEGKQKLRRRVAVEHALARLAHLGIGQARYKSKAKTRFQLLIAATVANLRRTWNWSDPCPGGDSNPPNDPFAFMGRLHAAFRRILPMQFA